MRAAGVYEPTQTFPKARIRTAATREAEAIPKEGVISNTANPNALEYLRGLWKRASDYVRGRALRGVVLSDSYLVIKSYTLNKHLAPRIKGMRLLELDADFMERVVLDMSAAGASPRTVIVADMRMRSVAIPRAQCCL
jgi:hypothetical protein